MVRKALIVLALTAIAGIPSATASPPASPPALTPEQAHAAGVTITLGIVHAVSPEAALAASKISGAFTEVAPGLTLRQAVGLDPVRRLARRTAGTTCWNNSDGASWDYWPYDRHLNDTTSWCGSGGIITYRSSHTSQNQTACSPQGTYGYKLAGGAGESYVAWRAGGNWACPSPLPWVTIYPNDWMSIYANGSGAYWIYETGGS